MKKNLFFLVLLSISFCFCLSTKSSERTSIQDRTPQGLEVKVVFVNGDSIHYIDIGKGIPVIFIHGALGDYRGFPAQRDAFSKMHRVIIYSRRYAYPDQQPIKDSLNYNINPHVKDLVEFIKLLNLGAVHLIGHSYGGFIALQIAIDHPKLVRSLTLCEPPYPSLLLTVPGGDAIWKNFVTKFKNPSAEAFKRGDEEKAVEIFIDGVSGDSLVFPTIPPAALAALMTNVPEARAIALTKEPFPAVTCQELKKIKVPVLLVGGEKSPALFTATTNELDRCLTNNEVLILHNTSHGLQNENPSEFNETALRFINRH